LWSKKKDPWKSLRNLGNYILLLFTWAAITAALTPGNGRGVAALCAVPVALTILFVTADEWGRFIGGFVGGRLGIALVIRLSSGEMPFAHGPALSSQRSVYLLAFCVVLLVLSWPLFNSKRLLTWIDRACFVAAFVALCVSTAVIRERDVWLSLMICLVFFVGLRLREQRDRRERGLHRALKRKMARSTVPNLPTGAG
jgi:hypothetical protein